MYNIVDMNNNTTIMRQNMNFNKSRQIVPFNTDWMFCREENIKSDPRLPDCDESDFEPVSLPHANTILTKHKGPDFQVHIESYRFVSFYRKHLQRPAA